MTITVRRVLIVLAVICELLAVIIAEHWLGTNAAINVAVAWEAAGVGFFAAAML